MGSSPCPCAPGTLSPPFFVLHTATSPTPQEAPLTPAVYLLLLHLPACATPAVPAAIPAAPGAGYKEDPASRVNTTGSSPDSPKAPTLGRRLVEAPNPATDAPLLESVATYVAQDPAAALGNVLDAQPSTPLAPSASLAEPLTDPLAAPGMCVCGKTLCPLTLLNPCP